MKKGYIEELAKISVPDYSIGKWYDFQIEAVKGSFTIRMG